MRFFLFFFAEEKMCSWPSKGFPGGAVLKNPLANAGDERDVGSIPGLGRFPWSGKWQLTPVFLPGKLQGQRSLVGYSPWLQRDGHDRHTHACTPSKITANHKNGHKNLKLMI